MSTRVTTEVIRELPAVDDLLEPAASHRMAPIPNGLQVEVVAMDLEITEWDEETVDLDE